MSSGHSKKFSHLAEVANLRSSPSLSFQLRRPPSPALTFEGTSSSYSSNSRTCHWEKQPRREAWRRLQDKKFDLVPAPGLRGLQNSAFHMPPPPLPCHSTTGLERPNTEVGLEGGKTEGRLWLERLLSQLDPKPPVCKSSK